MSQVGLMDMACNVLAGIGFYYSLGFLMKIVYSQHYKFQLTSADTFCLPFMMHLWTYILPVKGGLIFQTFFIKSKYDLDLSKGFSVGVLIFAVSLFVTSILGGLMSMTIENTSILRLLLSFMFLTLLLFIIAGKLVSRPVEERLGILNRIIAFTKKVLIQFNDQTNDFTLLSKLTLLTILSAFVQAGWFYQTASMLGFKPEPVGILLATLVLRIIVLIRLLPGNLGIQEFMTSAVFASAGLSIQEGLLTAVVIRFSSILLAATIGAAGTYINLHSIGMKSFEQLYNVLKLK